MARLIQCDGCGNTRISNHGMTLIEVTIKKDHDSEIEQTFDLCGPCTTQFERHSLPNKWPRPEKAK